MKKIRFHVKCLTCFYFNIQPIKLSGFPHIFFYIIPDICSVLVVFRCLQTMSILSIYYYYIIYRYHKLFSNKITVEYLGVDNQYTGDI